MSSKKQINNLKKYADFLESQNDFKFEKICHKIIYSVDGICPHCNKEIKTEKIEKISDDINKGQTNFINFRGKWLDKKKEHLPVISKVVWKVSYLLSGVCPYCNNSIESSYEGAVLIDNPPTDEIRNGMSIHTILKCSECSNFIHSVGFIDENYKVYYKWCTKEECHVM